MRTFDEFMNSLSEQTQQILLYWMEVPQTFAEVLQEETPEVAQAVLQDLEAQQAIRYVEGVPCIRFSSEGL